MGRNIENAVIDRIEEQMQEEGYTGLRGRYIPTAKNKPVEALYEKLGYHRTESTQEGGTCYEITLAERPERAYWLKETYLNELCRGKATVQTAASRQNHTSTENGKN